MEKKETVIKSEIKPVSVVVNSESTSIGLNSEPVLFRTLTEVYEYVGNTKGQNSKQLQKDKLKYLFTQLCHRNT